MTNIVVQELEKLWNEVDNSVWAAPRKERYYQQIYEPICDAAAEIGKYRQELENYSQYCINQCDIV